MTRVLVCSMVWLALLITVASAAPARPLYEPPELPKAASVDLSSLSGSAWLGKYNKFDRIFIFEADGTLSMKTIAPKSQVFKGRGSWKVESNALHFDYQVKGNTLMEFRGTIKDANTIVGESTSKAGVKTPQTLQRTTLEIK